MDIVMVGPFGLTPKHTMRYRALPIARALVSRGHHVTMLLPPWSNPADAGAERTDGGVHIVNLTLPPPIPILFHLWLTLALVRATLAIRPGIVHCFKPKAYAGLTLWALWHLRWLGVCQCRLVLDSDDWEGVGGWNEHERYSLLQKWFFAVQEHWCLSHADRVTIASRHLQSLVWSLGVPRARVAYVPNGVEASRFAGPPLDARAEDAPLRKSTVLLYTRFVEFSLSRVAALLTRVAEFRSDVQIVIVGTGLRGEEETLKSELHGVTQSRVSWRGWLAEEQLAEVFADATLAIYPMDDTLLNRTKCPVKVIDLMSAGVVVVGEAVGQLQEYIVPEASGLLVPSGDADAFFQAIVRILDDTALRQRLSQAARAQMRTHFSLEKIVQDVERVYAA